MRRRRLVFGFALALLLVLLLLVVGVFKTWDSPALGRAVLARAGALGGVELEAQEFRLALLDGLRLGEVHAVAELPAGRMTLDADEVILEHQLAPLLRRQVQVDRIVLRRPRLVLEEAPMAAESSPGAAPAKTAPAGPEAGGDSTPAAKGSPFSARVQEVLLEDAILESRPADPEMPPLVVEGLDLELHDLTLDDAALFMTSLRGQGALEVDRIVTADSEVVDARGDLEIGDGRLVVKDLDFQVVNAGKMTAPQTVVHLAEDPLAYDLELRGDLDLEGILGVGEKSPLGGAFLVFDGSGPLADVFASRGAGRVEVEPGNLPAAKLFQLIDAALGRSALVGAAYEHFDVSYELREREIVLEAFDVGTPDVGLTVSGRAGLDATVALLMEVRMLREDLKIEEIPKEALDALEDAEGRVVIPFSVGGPSADPRVALARQALMDAAKAGLRKEAETRAADEIGKALSSLLGGGDENDGDG